MSAVAVSVETLAYLLVCGDCLMHVANDDLSALDNLPDDERDERYRAVVAGVARAAWTIGGPTGDIVSTTEGDPEFRHDPCDTCDGLPGDRYDVAVLGPDEPDDRCTCGHPECGAC